MPIQRNIGNCCVVQMIKKKLSEHFKKLNNDENIDDEHDGKFVDVNVDEWSVNKYINEDFCQSEIRKIVSDLKNNKSQGVDQILNGTIDLLCPIYVKLFNLILHTGYIPEKWAIGIIIPIYKNKGPMDDPGNYRGITLLSCINKVFTSAISRRLYKFVENFDILGSEQAGFRKGHSTVDHIFVLYALFEIYVKKRKSNLYCVFVDYSEAFDTYTSRSLMGQVVVTKY